MARELGLNPKKLGQKDNHRQEPWKAPLPQFIEDLFFKRFGKTRPDSVRSIEQVVADQQKKKDERRAEKAARDQTNRERDSCRGRCQGPGPDQ